jgi:hypothetical protein
MSLCLVLALNELATFVTMIVVFPGIIDPENDATDFVLAAMLFLMLSFVWWLYLALFPLVLLFIWRTYFSMAGQSWPWSGWRRT